MIFEAENIFVHRVSPVTRPPNNHLPYEILIFLPFTYLQFGTAYVLWTLLNAGLLAGIVVLMRGVRPRTERFLAQFFGSSGVFPSLVLPIPGSGFDLVGVSVRAFVLVVEAGQDCAAGFVLALGLFRPQLVLPFVLVAFLAGKGKFVRGFVPGAMLALLLSTWLVGSRGMAEYGRILLSQGTQGSAEALLEQWRVRPGLMPTLRGLLWSLPSWVPRNIRNFVLLSGTFGALLWAARKMRSAKGRSGVRCGVCHSGGCDYDRELPLVRPRLQSDDPSLIDCGASSCVVGGRHGGNRVHEP